MRGLRRNLTNVSHEGFQSAPEAHRGREGSVVDSLVRLFGEQRPALTRLDEEALFERITSSVVARPPGSQLRRGQVNCSCSLGGSVPGLRISGFIQLTGQS